MRKGVCDMWCVDGWRRVRPSGLIEQAPYAGYATHQLPSSKVISLGKCWNTQFQSCKVWIDVDMLESHDQITGVADLKSKGKILSHTAKAQGKVHRFDSRVAKADPNSPNTFSKFLSRPARHTVSLSCGSFSKTFILQRSREEKIQTLELDSIDIFSYFKILRFWAMNMRWGRERNSKFLYHWLVNDCCLIYSTWRIWSKGVLKGTTPSCRPLLDVR